MTAPQSPLPPPEPHVMSVAAWKRYTAMHYTLMAKLAAQESTEKEKS